MATNQASAFAQQEPINHLLTPSTQPPTSQFLLPSSPQLPQNRILQRVRLRSTRPPPFYLPVRPDQKLFEIPLDALHPQQPGHLILHPFPNGLRAVSVHVRLLEHGETDAVVYLAEGLDRVIVARVLVSELVAGEAEDQELVRVGGGDFFVEFFEAFELGGEAAF